MDRGPADGGGRRRFCQMSDKQPLLEVPATVEPLLQAAQLVGVHRSPKNRQHSSRSFSFRWSHTGHAFGSFSCFCHVKTTPFQLFPREKFTCVSVAQGSKKVKSEGAFLADSFLKKGYKKTSGKYFCQRTGPYIRGNHLYFARLLTKKTPHGSIHNCPSSVTEDPFRSTWPRRFLGHSGDEISNARYALAPTGNSLTAGLRPTLSPSTLYCGEYNGSGPFVRENFFSGKNF